MKSSSSLAKHLFNFVAFLFTAAGWLTLVVAVVLGALLFYGTRMPGHSYRGSPPPLTAEQSASAGRMLTWVTQLAHEEHNTRHYEALVRSEHFINEQLQGLGLTVRRMPYLANGLEVANLEVVFPAKNNPRHLAVVVGAHYDSALGSPGANDNGSGVAALFEIARYLKAQPSPVGADIHLAFFVNEEPPYFRKPLMGSRVYEKLQSQEGVHVKAMFALETMGCFLDAAGSQKFPRMPGLKQLYPTEGNFIAFIGTLNAAPLVKASVGDFRQVAAFPSEGVAAPASVPGIDWSDHQVYAEHGVPALMVTDTAPYRYTSYHTHADTVDKVDFGKLARIVSGLDLVVWHLAQ